jgi:dethiobiotin synthetase
MLTADMIPLLNAKVIVVAQSKLGFLNHLFLTVEALRTRKIEVLGIVLFGECDLVPTVEKFTKTEVLAILPQVSSIFSAKIPEKVLQSL